MPWLDAHHLCVVEFLCCCACRYLRTGTAAGTLGDQDGNPTRILVTGACGQIGAELVSRAACAQPQYSQG